MSQSGRPPAFEAENLSVKAGREDLLRGISFFLAPGEMLVLAGPNGAGKSTLLRALACLSAPSGGSFRFQGQSIAAMPPRDRSRLLAFLPQDQPAHIPLTVEEVVMLGRSPWRKAFGPALRTPDETCLRRMEEADVFHLRKTMWDSLSGGERQRASLARILSQEARLLLLDEPTSALDYRHQLLVMDLLHSECRSGKCAVMATHDLNLASMYAGKAMLVAGGRCVASGTPAEVFTPANLEQAYHCPLLVDYPQCPGMPRISLPAKMS
ncbi:MAG: ABC transporter ATP-binding protein [Mailhella sp.]|nr:ABC transporter ATP-binding protein [Mailhella sp.]